MAEAELLCTVIPRLQTHLGEHRKGRKGEELSPEHLLFAWLSYSARNDFSACAKGSAAALCLAAFVKDVLPDYSKANKREVVCLVGCYLATAYASFVEAKVRNLAQERWGQE